MEKHDTKEGAISHLQIGNEDIALIQDMKDKINSKLGVHYESY